MSNDDKTAYCANEIVEVGGKPTKSDNVFCAFQSPTLNKKLYSPCPTVDIGKTICTVAEENVFCTSVVIKPGERCDTAFKFVGCICYEPGSTEKYQTYMIDQVCLLHVPSLASQKPYVLSVSYKEKPWRCHLKSCVCQLNNSVKVFDEKITICSNNEYCFQANGNYICTQKIMKEDSKTDFLSKYPNQRIFLLDNKSDLDTVFPMSSDLQDKGGKE